MKLMLCLLVCSVAAFAADVTGNWKAEAEGPNGAMSRTFVLKVEGAKLTGETVSTFAGKSVIENGKVDGDNLTFVIHMKIQDNEMTMNYKGKVVSNDEIKFTAESAQGGGQTIEWLAKRTK